ncbi:MAG: VPDSG-CTERM sorting domain-containing protein [Syntrophobacteraceae bacterium]
MEQRSTRPAGIAEVTSTPEPSTILLFGFGLLGLVIFRRKAVANMAD